MSVKPLGPPSDDDTPLVAAARTLYRAGRHEHALFALVVDNPALLDVVPRGYPSARRSRR